MIKQAVIIGCLVAGAAEARQQHPAQLASANWLDTEVSTNVTCCLDKPSLKRYWVEMGLIGTPSNNYELALGHDRNRDGRLSFEEQSIVFGWDCGEWFAFGTGGVIELTTRGPDTNGVVWAMFFVDIRRHRSNPPWMYSDTWDLMRLTRRGVDDPHERVELGTKVSGTLLFIR